MDQKISRRTLHHHRLRAHRAEDPGAILGPAGHPGTNQRRSQNIAATPNTFLTLDRNWVSGDVVSLSMSPTLTLEPTPDNTSVRAVKYGAIVLAGEYGSTNLSALPRLTTSSLRADPSVPLRFTGSASTGSVSLIPFFRMHGQRYTVYWQV